MADFIGEMNFLDGDVTDASDGEFDLDTGTGVVVRGRGDAHAGTDRPGSASVPRGCASCRRRGGRARSTPPRGVVATKMYLGDEVQVVATLDGGTRMLIREQRAGTDDSHDAIRPGDPITIQWDRTAPVLLAESPATEPNRQR